MNYEVRTDGSTPTCYRCGQALDANGRCSNFNFRWACSAGSLEGWASLPDGEYVKKSVYEDLYSQLCEEVRRRTVAETSAERFAEEARLANSAVNSHANEIVLLTARMNDLRTVLGRAYVAMAEPHGDWKDIREAKSLIEIRAMLGGEPT